MNATVWMTKIREIRDGIQYENKYITEIDYIIEKVIYTLKNERIIMRKNFNLYYL